MLRSKMFYSVLTFLTIAGASGLAYYFTKEKGPPPAEAFELPEVQAVLARKEKIKKCRIRLCALNSQMEKTVMRTASLTKVSSEDIVSDDGPSLVKQLITQIRELRVVAREILEQKDEYLATRRDFDASVTQAPVELRRTARTFADFSAKEPYAAIREDYLVMSQMLTSLANYYESQKEQFNMEFAEKDFLDATAYLERGELMLSRFEVALTAAESVSRIAEMQYYMVKISDFIRKFEDFRIQIRRANEVLREPDPAPTQGPTLPGSDNEYDSERTEAPLFDTPNEA